MIVVWSLVANEAITMASRGEPSTPVPADSDWLSRLGRFAPCRGLGVVIPLAGMALVLVSVLVFWLAGLLDPWDPHPERWMAVPAAVYGGGLLVADRYLRKDTAKLDSGTVPRVNSFMWLGPRAWAGICMLLSVMVALGLT